jgi:hypothetical protein
MSMRTVLPITSKVANASKAATNDETLPELQDTRQLAPPHRVVLDEVDARIGLERAEQRRLVEIAAGARRHHEHARQWVVLQRVERFAEAGQLSEFREALRGRAFGDVAHVLALAQFRGERGRRRRIQRRLEEHGDLARLAHPTREIARIVVDEPEQQRQREREAEHEHRQPLAHGLAARRPRLEKNPWKCWSRHAARRSRNDTRERRAPDAVFPARNVSAALRAHAACSGR